MENQMAVQVEKMQQVAVRLSRDVYDRLDDYRNKTRISKTATIEQAIIEYLDKIEKVEKNHFLGNLWQSVKKLL
tara:strand:+ start:30260 stop:30481 length:222 start_codon:yes stop_codon:yes gene_type:complete